MRGGEQWNDILNNKNTFEFYIREMYISESEVRRVCQLSKKQDNFLPVKF